MGKRPSSVSARASPSKKAKQKQESNSTSQDRQLVETLHEQVLDIHMTLQNNKKKNGNNHSRRLEEIMGQVERTVWPLFLQPSSDSTSSIQDHHPYWAKAAHLVAVGACAQASALGAYHMNMGVFGPDVPSHALHRLLSHLCFTTSNHNRMNHLEKEHDSHTTVVWSNRPCVWATHIHFLILMHANGMGPASSTSTSTACTATSTPNNDNNGTFQLQQANQGMTGLALWKHMPPRARELELRKAGGALRRQWTTLLSLTKDKTNHDLENDTNHHEDMVVQMVNRVLQVLEQSPPDQNTNHDNDNNDNDDDSDDVEKKDDMDGINGEWVWIQRALELWIDWLSTPHTRLFLKPYLQSRHVGIRCRRAFYTWRTSAAGGDGAGLRTFGKLVQTLQGYLTFPVVIGQVTSSTSSSSTSLLKHVPWTPAQQASEYHGRIAMLQKLVHRHYALECPELLHAGVAHLASSSSHTSMSHAASYLTKLVQQSLSHDQLMDLCHRLRLLHNNDNDNNDTPPLDRPANLNEQDSITYALQVLQGHFGMPRYPGQVLRENPLYPTEAILWDAARIPSSSLTSGESATLALPKLQLRFLSHLDYLVRNFQLLQLEAAYDIRSDLVQSIRRLQPRSSITTTTDPHHGDYYQNEDTNNDVEEISSKTEFGGWSRMALELKKPVQLSKVTPPKLGETVPAKVEAQIVLNLQHCGASLQQEWNQLREFDNLFLVSIDASQAINIPTPQFDDDNDATNENGQQQRRRVVSDEEDMAFPARYGVMAVRGCMVLEMRDEAGLVLTDPANHSGGGDTKNSMPKGHRRFLKVALDPAQYVADAKESGTGRASQFYESFNVVVRRHGKENNFKAVLETVRGLMDGSGSIHQSIPSWLTSVLLGYGAPDAAHYKSRQMRSYALHTPGVTPPDAALDYGDTFLDESHLNDSFPQCNLVVDNHNKTNSDNTEITERKKYRVRVLDQDGASTAFSPAIYTPNTKVEATSYPFDKSISGNPVRFTPVQVEAVRSGLSPGLTIIVGPPGTGKTDVAVQIIANLYHSFPTQRTVIVTHSNAALNDLFEKVMARGDIPERYLLRLGSGERDLQTTSQHDFTKMGRVAHTLERRATLLEQVQLLSESLGVSGKAERGADGSPSYTCETAGYFNLHHVLKRIHLFEKKVKELKNKTESDVSDKFPFRAYFGDIGKEGTARLSIQEARARFSRIQEVFLELAEYRPLELLRSQRQRSDYLLTKQARVVAMTCTHAAIARSHLIEVGFQYDNLLMEEAAQMMEIETFVPLLLQKGESDIAKSRLKRICLIGDHHQLPPVVKNMAFSKFSNLDQSLFTRLIRLGVPYTELNRQGRARASIARLYSWRYRELGDLGHVSTRKAFKVANSGFKYAFQMINVEDFEGRGESTPTAYFYQNVGEAEYAVALFQYMVLIGYPPERISILTTYNGQKDLLNDILGQRCGDGTPLAGVRPGAVSTVDHYQGQQNDYVILSLVRTQVVGHVRDVRRLVVAVSRARLGLYVVCRQSLFLPCLELKPCLDQFVTNGRSTQLQIVTGEHYPTERNLDEKVPSKSTLEVTDVSHLGSIVHSMQEQLLTTGAQ